MAFESLSSQVPEGFVDHNKERLQKLDLPITPDALTAECQDDERCMKALAAMLEYAVRYSGDVWHMKMLVAQKSEYSEEEWAELLANADSERTRLHNTLIDSIAILSRAMNAQEKNTDWVRELAPAGTLERARCGKFAIMLTYWLAVNSL